MTDPELLAAAIQASGLSARKFAERVLVRDERTVRRWLAGDSPIPKVVKEMLRVEAARRPVGRPRKPSDD